MSDENAAGCIQDAPLREELEGRYLAYALSTIISRSLPDVRDGLKPVHRRILFAMRALHLDPNTPFKKSARVVGDVIGKFHPHGDQAAYDAMVRLAQDFAVRYPLVDGQGNFGNIDGDGAAAMRYTEARLTKVAMALMEDLDQETVGFTPTYDGSLEEPQVFPARFPNLLANGSSGIAVGMATSIPPHNVSEILDACLHLIDHPQAVVADLLPFLPAPDFPTGGVLVSDPAEYREIYETGRGGVRLRARWHVERQKHGVWTLVITEIPYQVPKARLIERIAQLITVRKCPFLADVRDESDQKVRIVLEPRTSRLDPDKVMAYLFKQTELEVRVPVNLNVITAATEPRVLNLKELLRAWLDHRFQVHTRRAQYELQQIGERLHLLAAFLLVHLNIDEVIAIIKAHDDPAPVLMKRFSLDAAQAEAILNMRLRSLRKLEEMTIRKEMAEKEARQKHLNALLADAVLMWREIRKELKRTRTEFADTRRTELAGVPVEIDIRPEDLVEREPLTVILSEKGWIRTVKGHDVDESKLRFKRGDGPGRSVKVFATDTLTFVTVSGKVFSTLADRLPSGQGFGEFLTVFFDIDLEDPLAVVFPVREEGEYFIATWLGQGFRIKGADLLTSHRTGKQVVTVGEGDRVLTIQPVRGSLVGAIGLGRRLLISELSEFPVMSRGKGVRIIRLHRGEHLVDVTTGTPEAGFTLDSGRRQKQLVELDYWRGVRGGRGAMLPHGFLGGAVFAASAQVLQEVNKGLTGDLFSAEGEGEEEGEGNPEN